MVTSHYYVLHQKIEQQRGRIRNTRVASLLYSLFRVECNASALLWLPQLTPPARLICMATTIQNRDRQDRLN